MHNRGGLHPLRTLGVFVRAQRRLCPEGRGLHSQPGPPAFGRRARRHRKRRKTRLFVLRQARRRNSPPFDPEGNREGGRSSLGEKTRCLRALTNMAARPQRLAITRQRGKRKRSERASGHFHPAKIEHELDFTQGDAGAASDFLGRVALVGQHVDWLVAGRAWTAHVRARRRTFVVQTEGRQECSIF